jgi:PAS domain-containing protein
VSQQEIEVILARQLATYLALPVFIVGPEGTLLFFNEPAEAILGRRFAETGELGLADWSTLFRPTDEAGQTLAPDALPLVIALRERKPAHSSFWITGLDGRRRFIDVTAFPLIGQADRYLGGVAIFWEKPA